MSSALGSASALTLLMLLGSILRLALLMRHLGESEPQRAPHGRKSRPARAVWDIGF